MNPLRTIKQIAAVAPIAMRGRRGQSRQALAERLGPLKGASTKIAQLLAAREGEDAGRALEPLPLHQLMPTLRAAAPELLGSGAAIRSSGRRASLGQVHRATLSDDRDAAVKVLLPGVADDLRSDLSLIGWIGRRARRRLGRRFEGVAVDDWITALGDELIGELNYRSEGDLQARYREAAAGLPHVVVPELILAVDEVLISAWEDGTPLKAAATWDVNVRSQLASALCSAVLCPMLAEGLVHGDLHPGNIALRTTSGGEVVLYDFGATRAIAPAARGAWRSLLRGDEPAWDALMALGFDGDRLDPLRERLDDLTAMLFAPFRKRGPSRMNVRERRAKAEALLGAHRMLPRLAAPTSAIPVVRTISGLLSILGHLDAPMELWTSLESLPPGPPPKQRPQPSGSSLAEAPARVLVQSFDKNGRGVELRLPFKALLRLEDLLPDGAQRSIQEAGVDLGALAREAWERGPVPQTLFDAEVQGRRVQLRVIAA